MTSTASATASAATLKRQRLPRAQRRERILQAAEAIFERRGYEGASMDEIATRSQVTKALLYQHFASKQDLYVACAVAAGNGLLDQARAQIETVPPGPEQIRAYASLYFGFVRYRSSTWQLLFDGDGTNRAAAALRERNAEMVATLLLDALAAANTPADRTDVEPLAHALAGAAEQVGRWWRAHPQRSEDEVVSRFSALAAGAIVPVFRELEQRSTSKRKSRGLRA